MEAGTLVGGRYRVLSLLGEGGMARVYEVEHAELGRHFALKVLHPKLVHERAQVERFQQEARAVARLDSPQIVGTVDCGFTEEGSPFFVMELLRGSDLRELLLQEGQLSALRAIHLALDVCRGLAVAHEAGIVHRDLKPENLFVTRDADGKEQCKLLDFGIAKLTEANQTLPGTLLGTIRYMAPEQLGSEQPLGPATDLFALGVTLFECLAGRPPFEADTVERVLFKIMNQPAPSLLALRPDLEPRFAQLVMSLLAKDVQDRPKGARALAADLSACLAAGPRESTARAVTRELSALPVPSPAGEKRAARPAAVAAVGALVAFAALGAWWAVARRSAPQITTSAGLPPPFPDRLASPVSARTPEPLPVVASSAGGAPPSAIATAPTPRTQRAQPRASALTSVPSSPPPALELPLFYPRSANPRRSGDEPR